MKELNRISKRKKCVLISPPENGKCCTRGILSIAAFLEAKGYPTAVVPLAYDMGIEDMSPEKIESVLADVIREHDPLTIGVSCLTCDYRTCKEILKISKQLNENIVTLMGGIHATLMDEDCIRLPFTDIVIRGEGEWTMLELISALENGSDLHKVRGLTFKEKDKVIQTPDRPLGDLNELPLMDFGLLPYEFVQNSYAYGMLSRGCAFNCNFCADNRFWQKVRRFPTSRVIHEMETLEHFYKSPMVAIEDNMVYIGSRQFSELCTEIKKRKITLGPQFYVLTRADSVVIEEQGIRDMEGTGIEYVILGIESGSPKVLKMMNKKTTPQQILAGCEKLRKYDLSPIGLWMIGHPGDTPEETEHSLKLLDHLLREDLLSAANFSYFIPWPGTCFFDDPEKYGIEVLVEDWSNWNFRLKAGSRRRPICQLKDFPAHEMEACHKAGCEIIDKYSAHPFWECTSESDGVSFETFHKAVKEGMLE